MSIKSKVLDILKDNFNSFSSGAEMAQVLNVSRNAIWKTIKKLQMEGYNIESNNPLGYKLLDNNYPISSQDILKYVKEKNVTLEVLDETPSTNEYLKALALKGESEFYTIIAHRQSSGKGRNGKSFHSPKNTGVYLSMLLRPSFGLEKSLNITTATAVAVSKTIEKTTLKKTSIKWVNDVFIGDRKVSGILTEGAMDLETRNLSHVVLGVGVNLFKPKSNFPKDINDKAGYILEDYDAKFKEKFIGELIDSIIYHYRHLDSKEIYEYYREKSYLKGRVVEFLYNGKLLRGRVLDIDKDFFLVISTNNKVLSLYTGSVNVV
ncbi:biotin--[acetyl-CoA-carboxylase] ligase [Lagierella sp.]|uniref:biotin--[acetyl-CoA-carboxylase] ligase n=1 Tax=Lagierella sp. TaxID=2849657 RepID=UPI00260D9B66|nr:biotin--[acetyl-CoA-carboxylase] ligase [Lagierella sp.]